jgi:phage terminase large subunit-like protein
MLATNTPAVDQIVATEQSAFYQRVVRGEFQDDAAFAYIARTDPGDDPFNDETCWPKSLPALGITFPASNVRQRVNTSRGMISEQMATSRLYFGRPVGSANFWIDEAAWNSCQGVVNEEACRGLPCALALDLSRKNDLTALSAAWTRPDGHVLVKTWTWTPREGLEARARADNAPYEQWIAAGFLEAVPGPVIEKSFIAKRVSEICERHDVRLLAFDVWGIDSFIEACDDIGFDVWRYRGDDEPEGVGLKLVPHAQGTRVLFEEKQLCMPRSIERLEDAIKTGTITIDDSPVTRMCAGNAIVVSDAQNNRAFDKRRSRGRIDSLVTVCMATGAAHKREAEPPGESVYEVLARQAAAKAGDPDIGQVDWQILQDVTHPRFEEMKRRFESKMALEDNDADY